MIEILFGEGEAGSMKVAKNTVVIGKTDGPVSVWIAGKTKAVSQNDGREIKWIQGTAQEVICLGFLLDMGDIQEDINSRYRKDFIYSMLAAAPWCEMAEPEVKQSAVAEMEAELEAELRGAVEVYCREWERLKGYLEDGEPVRVWYSDAPYSLCGFYHVCSLLQNYENEVHVIKMLEYKVSQNTTVRYHNWGNVAAEEFASFLPYEKMLSQSELRMYAGIWRELQQDNSALRAVVNGNVVGVSEDFYDFLIWKQITQEPIKEARLIGDILGRYPMGIGDWWYAGRIDKLIAQGKIKVCQNNSRKYARMLALP